MPNARKASSAPDGPAPSVGNSPQLHQLIAPDVKLGKDVRIFGFVNLYGCEIGDEVKIGTFVEIQKKAKIGFDYVHSVVDDHSRLAYSEILPNEQGPTCAAFLARAAEVFAAHGITRIERVMTDNHWSYTKSPDVAAVLDALDAKHVLIKPHCPWQNGKVERFNRTLQTEWAYRSVFNTNNQRRRALAPWLRSYNTRRRHSALGGLPPISRLSPT